MTKTRVKTKFKKTLVLDTNIILNDVENIFKLSDNGNNLIVLPETVLDEMDTKKSGLNEINYQAREFARTYDEAVVLKIDRANNKKLITISSRMFKNDAVAYVNVVSKKKYDSDNDRSIPSNIRNDRKIIEIARDLQTESSVKNVFFVSLDIMAKHRALSIGVDIHNLKLEENKPIQLMAELKLEEPEIEYSVFDIFSMDVPETVQHLQITDKCGKPFFYYRTGNIFKLLDESLFSKHEVKPNNMGQKVLMTQMMDEYFNVVASDSPAGSGKTLIALSAAMRLVDLHRNKYDKIIYIRRTVLSDSEDVGFLKGNLDEKVSGYLAPLYSNLEFIVEKKYSNRKTKLTKEELDAKLQGMMDKYQIQFKYEGHLRGDNVRNAIIIWDEGQNDSISGAKTILTRISENCKVFILGSTKQIDTQYLNKFNNSLTFIMNKIGKDNKNVNLTGFNLTKTVRSAIAEWADDF